MSLQVDLSDKVVLITGAGIPMGRLAKTEEQADMVLFLCSEHANHISGQTFFVDGGQTMV